MSGKVYYLATCDTCKRILKEVGTDGLELHEIKSTPISAAQLDEMKALAGSYEVLFSKIARKYKELNLKDQALSEADYRRYLLEEYTFLKRPVFVLDQEIFIGNSPKTVAAVKEKIGK